MAARGQVRPFRFLRFSVSYLSVVCFVDKGSVPDGAFMVLFHLFLVRILCLAVFVRLLSCGCVLVGRVLFFLRLINGLCCKSGYMCIFVSGMGSGV